MAIKLRLYVSVVIPAATYACKMRMRTASITNMLVVFHRRCHLENLMARPHHQR
ncbi:hypothetical protein ABVT39_012976 [Epinephelus coioides]